MNEQVNGGVEGDVEQDTAARSTDHASAGASTDMTTNSEVETYQGSLDLLRQLPTVGDGTQYLDETGSFTCTRQEAEEIIERTFGWAQVAGYAQEETRHGLNVIITYKLWSQLGYDSFAAFMRDRQDGPKKIEDEVVRRMVAVELHREQVVQREIGDLLGVSHATISRALKDAYDTGEITEEDTPRPANKRKKKPTASAEQEPTLHSQASTPQPEPRSEPQPEPQEPEDDAEGEGPSWLDRVAQVGVQELSGNVESIPPPREPRRANYMTDFRDAVMDCQRASARLTPLFMDDRFTQYREEAAVYASGLVQVQERVTLMLDAIQDEEAPVQP